ncbi:MAG TPA: YggW family oxidoreductase, partial [Acidiferrobacteraceae bacterium]|nr:YggW family oxidoreductase [Acidiferrobacteraceae bacterium]
YGDYLGIGAGAHGKRTAADTIWRTRKPRQPERYMASAGDGITAAALRLPVAPAERAFEFMLNALRLVQGFPLTLFEARCGLAADTLRDPLERARALGLLTQRGVWVQPTAQGLRFLNDLQALFLPATTVCAPA